MMISSTGLVTWTPGAGEQGNYSITLAVTNQYGGQALQHYILAVVTAPPSGPPLFTSTPNPTANVLTPYQYTATAEDPDGSPPTYSVVSGPAGLSINPTTGVVTWSPVADEVGSQRVTLAVSDASGGVPGASSGFAEQSYLVQVLPQAGDVPPVIDDNSTTFTAQLGTPFLHQVNAADANSIATLSYSLLLAPSGMTIDPVAGLVQWTPLNAGTYTFKVQVADGLGGVTTQSYTVSVVNTAPGSISGTVFDDLAGNGILGGSDTELSGWTVYIDLHHDQTLESDDPQTVTNSQGAYTFTNLAPGTYRVEVVPQTGWLPTLPIPGTTQVTVAPGQAATNQNFGEAAQIAAEEPPVLAPSVNLTAVLGDPFSYQISASSPEGYSLTYSLTASEYPGVTVDPESGILTWTPQGIVVNFVVIQVSDGHGGMSGERIDLTVNPLPNPPVITSEPPEPAVAGSPYEYQVEAQDSDPGTTLSYSLLEPPDGMSIDPNSGLITWTPPAGQTTSAEVAIVVTDSDGLWSGQEYLLTAVVPVAEVPPTIASVSPGTAVVNVPYVFQIEATSAYGTPLSYSLTAAPAGMSISQTGEITWISSTPVTADVTVQVADAEGGSSTVSFTIQVIASAGPVNPTITSQPPGPAQLGFEYDYQVTVTDASDTPDTFMLQTAPAGMSIDPATGLVTWMPQASAVPSTPVTITVENATGGTSSQSFNLSVVAAVPSTPPIITSTPGGPAVVGLPYEYQVVAQDQNDSPLFYFLDQAPSGMTVSDTGLLTWEPTSGQLGSQQVTIAVVDARGAMAEQNYTLSVVAAAPDNPPVITSTPAINAIPVGDSYQYQVVANSPEDYTLTYNLDDSASGMSVDPNLGLFTWTPTAPGTYQVLLDVSDGQGGDAQQPFTLTVVPAGSATDTPPTISSNPVEPAIVGQPWQYQVVAQSPDDNALVTRSRLRGAFRLA